MVLEMRCVHGVEQVKDMLGSVGDGEKVVLVKV